MQAGQVRRFSLGWIGRTNLSVSCHAAARMRVDEIQLEPGTRIRLYPIWFLDLVERMAKLFFLVILLVYC